MNLLLLLLAGTPSAADAESLASKKQWDELYLQWAAVKPDDFSDDDKKRIAKALGRGCVALSGDAVMAQSLGEKAVLFAGAADGDALWCTARAALKLEQRGAAEAMLRTGRRNFPKDERFAIELGRLLVGENDGAGALKELQGVKSKDAQPLLKRAMALTAQDSNARAELKAIEKSSAKRQVAVAEGRAPSQASTTSYESGVDGEGRRMRFNAHFRFRYFNGQRDFGQRADYEGRVQAALEEARVSSDKLLGTARDAPTDVILYSREEFVMHHGAQAARSVAGFYSENAIRMNDTAEINPHNQAVLVHEYVHAVLDEVAHFHDERVPIWLNEGLATWVEWRYMGLDGPPLGQAVELRGLAQTHALPSLREMGRSALIAQGNPAMRYALSGAAVGLLIKEGGTSNLVGLFSDVGSGAQFDATFSKRYGKSLAEFEEKLADELKSR